jgi:hypothetical protein
MPEVRRSTNPGCADCGVSNSPMSGSENEAELILRKLARLRSGAPPRYMDLFSGCGGISLGFLTAGFAPVASVEVDGWAALSHGANFGARCEGGDHPGHHVARDAVNEDPESMFAELGLAGPVDQQVDVLVGGPPCQAFARVGRAKLREQAHRREEVTADQAFPFPRLPDDYVPPRGVTAIRYAVDVSALPTLSTDKVTSLVCGH